MADTKFNWKYGENDCQKYYEAKVGKDYLCVFANKWNADTWQGMYNNTGIQNKTLNDAEREIRGIPMGNTKDMTRWYMLCSNDPEYMMKKVEQCYINNLIEIEQ